jgi:DNA-binding LacI/PurR family transcriptional regulator
MDDVARASGVSKATVSRVLAGVEGGWSPATAETVRETARRLGYVVNSVASSLRSRQTFTIGLIIADVSNPFFGGIAKGVEDRLSQTGYSVILGNSGNSLQRERHLVQVLVEKQIDGLIAATSASDSQHFLDAQQSGVGVVLVDSELPDSGLESVTIDNHGAAKAGVGHLLAQGHRRIGVVTGPLDAAFDRQRLEGSRAALAPFAHDQPEIVAVQADLEAKGGEAAAHTLMCRSDPPTAVFVTNNMMTLGFLVGLASLGLRVPDDVSLIAFDDQDWYSITSPPLTGIRNPAHEMGHVAAERLLRQITSLGGPDIKAVLDAPLILRDSVRPPRR